MSELFNKIFDAGVVGAGGAGFPTHVKAKSKVDFMLANGAECEPLIHKDVELMENFPEEIVNGFNLMVKSTEAKTGYFGLKGKNINAVEKISPLVNESGNKMVELGDFYPAGDEYELVYEATKRLIPPAGIPLDVGCVVNNVETLMNVFYASEGKSVTEKFVCVTGAVKKPLTFFVPIGTSYKELIEIAGGSLINNYSFFVGGAMMGTLSNDLNDVVTKTTAGLIVLPNDHYLIKRKSQPEENWHRIGKSACDQCSYCTEFCPRYLLGYDVQPHQVMRSLGFTKTGEAVWNLKADLCCACGLCTLYACPEDLYPKEACDRSKKELKKEGTKYIQTKPVKVHPMKEGRRVPLKQLIKRLNLQDYDVPSHYLNINYQPEIVNIKLKQHIGETAVSKVSKGSKVKKGEAIAFPPDGKLGAVIHASIEGTVTDVTENLIQIRR